MLHTNESIPMNQLDHIKDCLNSCDIYYTEGVHLVEFEDCGFKFNRMKKLLDILSLTLH
jgi:hypothetical protein